MKHILAVYDVDPVYAARFAEVVNQKEKIPFEVVAFSSIERLRAFAAEHPVKLLLLGEHVPAEEKESIRAEKVILYRIMGKTGQSVSSLCLQIPVQRCDCARRDDLVWGKPGGAAGGVRAGAGEGLGSVFAGWTVFKDLVCPDNGKTFGTGGAGAVSEPGGIFPVCRF
ncbi:MAG: hypothetical protein ACLTR6_13330 [Clostridium fessum]